MLLPIIGISRQAYCAAVQTETEIEWYCDSCALELSSFPGEPVAASSRLENIDSWESHLEQGSTVGKKNLISYTYIAGKPGQKIFVQYNSSDFLVQMTPNRNNQKHDSHHYLKQVEKTVIDLFVLL